MLEHDWLLTALIYGLIGCFRSKLSDLACPITKNPSQSKSRKSSYVSRLTGADWKQTWTKLTGLLFRYVFLRFWLPFFHRWLRKFLARILLLTQLILVIGLRVVQFRGNRARNFKSASRYALVWFEITRQITPWIVLHSVLLPLLIHQNITWFSRARGNRYI